jgi:hypothetical protein
MPAVDAYGERRAMEVRQDTWGHLAPKPRKKYRGYILIGEGQCSGQGRTIIRDEFVDLDHSPWFYQAMCDYVGDLEGLEEGNVYLWTGTYQFFLGTRERGGRKRYLDESSYWFEGNVQLVPIRLPDLAALGRPAEVPQP